MGVKTLFSLTQESLEDEVITDENTMELSEEELQAPIDAIVSDEMSLEEIESEIDDVQELIRVNVEAADQLVTLLEAKKEKLTAVSTESENKDEEVTISFEEVALMANEAKVIYASIGYAGAKEVSTEGLEDDPKAYLEAVISVEEQAIEDIEFAIVSAEGMVSDLVDKAVGGLKKFVGNYTGAAKNLYKLVESKEKAGAVMTKDTLPAKSINNLAVSASLDGDNMVTFSTVTKRSLAAAVVENNKIFAGIIKDITEGLTKFGASMKVDKEEKTITVDKKLNGFTKFYNANEVKKVFANKVNKDLIAKLDLGVDAEEYLIVGINGGTAAAITYKTIETASDALRDGVYGFKEDPIGNFIGKKLKIGKKGVEEAKTLTIDEIKSLTKELISSGKKIAQEINSIEDRYKSIPKWKDITKVSIRDRKSALKTGAKLGAGMGVGAGVAAGATFAGVAGVAAIATFAPLFFTVMAANAIIYGTAGGVGAAAGQAVDNKNAYFKVTIGDTIVKPSVAFGNMFVVLNSLIKSSNTVRTTASKTLVNYQKDALKYGSMSLAAHGKAKKESKEDKTEE